jgi:septal ring factor EnvC (AmiA/AmiB activator)
VGGVTGESNTVRIGDNLPTGAGLSQCFIGGILSKFTPLAPGNPLVTIDPLTQQLGWTMDFSANKIAEQEKKIEEQQASIAELKSTVAQQQKGMELLTAQLREQAAQIQRVSAQLEVSKPAPQVVTNKP